MEKSFHRFSELFSQLGLRMDAAGIGEFLEAHAPLPADVLLADDLTGRGHTTAVYGNAHRVSIAIPLAD